MTQTEASIAVVVNDDATQRNTLSALLEKAGLEVQSFAGAAEALAAMDANAPPALIVTDLSMPDIDGWRFCRLLRSAEYAAFNPVPILVVSATYSGQDADGITADAGADAFIPFPVDGRQFVGRVHALLNARTVHELPQVLIVEDSRTTALILSQALAANGYRPCPAHDLKAAEEAITRTAFDLAVIDFHLPDGQGDRLLDRLRAERPDCVAIMMTSDPRPELALQWMSAGAAAYLRKPFDPRYLVEICTKTRRERALLRGEALLETRTRQLRRSEAYYQALFESVGDAVLVHEIGADGRPGKFIEANAIACQRLEYSRDALMQLTPMDITPTDAYRDLAPVRKAIATTGEAVFETEHITCQGQRIQVESHVRTFALDGRRLALSVVRDLSERNRLKQLVVKKSKERRLLLDTIDTQIWYLTDIDTYGAVNRAHADFLGFRPEEIAYKKLEEFLAKEVAAICRQGNSEVFETGRPVQNEEWIPDAQGRQRLIRIHKTPKLDEQGRVEFVVCAGTDITDLRTSEERFRRIFEDAPIGIELYDADGRMSMINATAVDIFGIVDPTEVAGFGLFADPNLGSEQLAALADGRTVDFEARFDFEKVRATGLYRTAKSGHIDVNVQIRPLAPRATGQHGGFILLVQDVSERNRLHRELAQSEAKYRRLVKNIPAVVFQFRMGPDGSLRFPYVSDTVLSVLGVSADAAMRNPGRLLDMLHPEEKERFDADMHRSATSLAPYHARFRSLKDGRTIWIEIRSTPERLTDGSVLWEGFFLDITPLALAEMKIREQEHNFSSFFATMTDMVFVATTDGRIVHTNPAVARILGFREEELTTKHILDMHQAEDRDEAAVIINAMLQGEREICPLPLRANNGTLVPVNTRIWFGTWGGADCIFGISKDLTAEEDARQRFERMFQNNPALMAVTDAPERKFVQVNDAFLAALGYPRDEIIGRSAAELGLFAAPQSHDILAQALATGGRFLNQELQVRCKDGSLKDGLFSGEVIKSQGRSYFLTVMVDITERKQAEAALRQRAAFERLVGEIASDLAGVGGADVDPTIDRALASLGFFTGADRAYVFQFRDGESLMDNTHEWCAEGIQAQITHLQNILPEKELPWFADRIRRRETIHVPDLSALPPEACLEQAHFEAQGIQALIVVPMETAGSLLGFLGFDAVRRRRDWTEEDRSLLQFAASTISYVIERRRGEENRIALERRFQQGQKVESLERMAGAIAHHFNNHLAVILGNLELAAEDLSPETEVSAFLKQATLAAQRATRISQTMLTYLGQMPAAPEAIDLSARYRALLADLDPAVAATFVFDIDLPASGPIIRAGADRVREVFTQILTNAREAIGDGGGSIGIRISTVFGPKIREPHLFPLNFTARASTYAFLEVVNHGDFIPESEIDKIFDPFYTTKFTGRGLGLSVVLGAVGADDGAVAVSRDPEGRTVFRVYWPVDTDVTHAGLVRLAGS